MAMADSRVDLYMKRIYTAEIIKSRFRPIWVENWAAYTSQKRTPMVPNMTWKKNITIPDAFRIIETMVPQHVQGMFNNPNWFSVEAPTVAGMEYRSMVKSLLLAQWENADMFRKMIEGTKYALITGHVVYKVVWEEITGEQEVVDINFGQYDFDGDDLSPALQRGIRENVIFRGCQVYVVDLVNLWLDPTRQNEWVVERIPVNVEKLTERNKKYKGTMYNQGAIDRAKKTAKGNSVGSEGMKTPHQTGTVLRTGGAYSSGPYDVASLLQSVNGIVDIPPEDSAEMLQCWGWVPPSVKRYSDTQWRLIKILNAQEVISDNPIPAPDLKPPYIGAPAVPIPHSLYGGSVLTPVKDLMELRSFLESARKEEVIQGLFQQMIAREDITFSPDALLYKPGGVRYIKGGFGPIDDAIKLIDRRPVMPEAYTESAIKEDQILKTTGATEPFQGAFSGGRKTATEFTGTMQVGMGRFSLATQYADEASKKPILELMFKYLQTRLTRPETVEWANGKRDDITLMELQYGTSIRVDSGKLGSVDQAQANSLMQWYGMFANNPTANGYLNHGEWIKEIMYRSGFMRTDRLVKDDDQVAQEMEAAQAAAQGAADQQHEQALEQEYFKQNAGGGAGSMGQGGGTGS